MQSGGRPAMQSGGRPAMQSGGRPAMQSGGRPPRRHMRCNRLNRDLTAAHDVPKANLAALGAANAMLSREPEGATVLRAPGRRGVP